MTDWTVMLDAGHGRETKGKRSPDGELKEYEWNRRCCSKVVEMLEQLGLPYYIVTPEINDISLSTRVARANAKYTELNKKAFFISIHVNAAGNGVEWKNAQGWSIWTSKGQTAGDKLADEIFKAAETVLKPLGKKVRKDMSDNDPDYESDFTVLKKTNCPACLIENFFMDNKEDKAWLLTEQGVTACATVIVYGILNYINYREQQ